MRLIMMGTGPFAVPTFRRLRTAGHEVPLLVTRPAKPSSGRGPAPINPMRATAEELGIAVLAPATANDDEVRAELAKLQPDLLVVCDYGEILKAETLAVAKLGGINLHASLLPKYRGAAPINWAMYYGDAETGNTVIHMTPQLDAGPTIAQGRTPIGPTETSVDLEARLANLGADLVLQAIADLAAGNEQSIVQDNTQATKAPRLKKSDGEVNWSRTAIELFNQLRAFQPWPQMYTFWQRPGKDVLRLIIHGAEVAPAPVDAHPGIVLPDEAGGLLVATGSGALRLLSIQPAGKKALSAGEFLRGYQVAPGERLG
jgi:methionyl-tRNA formyltransferase